MCSPRQQGPETSHISFLLKHVFTSPTQNYLKRKHGLSPVSFNFLWNMLGEKMKIQRLLSLMV